MTEQAIESLGLRKEFGEKVAVADLTLSVGRGEIFGFLGPNGAGKTTSIKMLLGLTKPTAGTANLLGRPFGSREVRTRIGFLPEHFRFHEWLTAAEFLDLHGRLYGMSRAARSAVIPDLLELVGLGHRAKTKLSAFSKGMLQRVGLAQAMINDPELIFLDEPTSGLDPLGRRLVRDIINGLRAEKTTVFLNSHLLSEIELTCDRVAFIREGKILQVASLKDLENLSLQIILRVGRPTPELLDGLNNFGTSVHFEPKKGNIQLTLQEEDQIPEMVNWLVSQNQNIYELSPRRLSLEDIFLQIIGDEMYDA
jgi:ABC-2 type transport system ATP-binding protein